jgi:uncharacterized protein YxjI
MRTTTERYEPAAIDLSGNQYTVEQTGKDENMRPEYEATNVTGDTVFSAIYNMYQKKDEFSFADGDGTEICAVKAEDAWDIAGDYVLADSRTGKDLVALENDVSLLQDTWRIRDADDGSLLAEISSRGGLITLGRTILPLGGWIGHEYEITDAEGDSVGSIESEFAVFDEYDITIADTSSVPTEAIVIGAVVIDGIQAN